MAKLWGGRFKEESSSILEKFNASIDFDKRIYKEDIKGSIAHSRMLAKQGIIDVAEQVKIEKGLLEIREEIDNGGFNFSIKDEDIHMAIEKRLIEKIGDVGGKLHTARSRNDQVAVGMKMHLIEEAKEVKALLHDVMKCLLEKGEKHVDTVLPGYTHLQRAQPISFTHHLMAYFEMFKRDVKRIDNYLSEIDELPLGAGALAGTTYPIDRRYVAKELGFSGVTSNSLDTVSDRDFIIELNFILSMIAMHLSRFCEEIIIWSTTEFSFVEVSDGYSTGSSIMPQKKNPDVAELIRGKSGRVYGNLVGILTVMKGLPLAYNKDTQEDKEGVFDSLDTVKSSLAIFTEMIATMKINKENMKKNLEDGFINATDVADYLAKKGIPFRDAHRIVGELVIYCESKGLKLSELKLAEYKEFNEAFSEDIFTDISIEGCVFNRNSEGGTGRESLIKQLADANKYIKGE